MAAGLLIDEGKLDLSENIYKIFHDKGSTWAKIFRPEVTVENLMTMTSGVTFNESGIVSGNDWLESYLNAPVSEKPGTKFQYNSLNSYVLSAIITERTGMPMDEYLKPRLFEPLGLQIICGRNVREELRKAAGDFSCIQRIWRSWTAISE